ncbi:porin family protein [Lysobacter solisilvae (ex Woo and Kim 2020)]|uniref:Porin family protein n=1 Tax=Agrilutibacter terrestris TaxID=2865112 RepID=A0A7H0FTM4_9GAMM|nr:porin family protein [Lysobacter terrestris]QNP39390.1 porin family protein [Lysobacter terrestris]
MKKILVLSAALALAGLSTSAMAAGGQGFARVEVGNSDVDVDVSGLGSGSDSDTGYSLRGGYYFNDNFAVEGAYNSLYDQDGAELTSFGVGLMAKKSFGANNSGFFIDGRIGVERVKGDVDGSDTSTEPYYGVGAGYDFSESFGLSLNYDFHSADFDGVSVDADTLNLAGEFRF